jgi:hypothetical protein
MKVLVHLRGNFLGRGEALLGVDPDALGVADEHAEDLVLVADAGDIARQRLRARRADHIQPGPELATRRVGAALLVGAADDRRGRGVDGLAFEQRPRQGEVVAGVLGLGASCVEAPSSLRPTSPRSTVQAPCERPEHRGRSVSELASADHVDVYTNCDRG